MTAQKGEDLLLKIGDGGIPTEVFTDVGGLIKTNISVNNEVVESNSLSTGAYRTLLSGLGIQSLSITSSGYFTDSSTEELLRVQAFGASSSNYELHFGNGDKLSAQFVISNYERSGSYGAQEDFFVTLESSGNIMLTMGG